jgi:hypothetical protein
MIPMEFRESRSTIGVWYRGMEIHNSGTNLNPGMYPEQTGSYRPGFPEIFIISQVHEPYHERRMDQTLLHVAPSSSNP